ncbi:hypothetical protein K32_49500 [Kaistia sp. 32K]|uniref:hypothetical protein n=1 Tax=Kaistia sp. 32K TaxID=2795690 RepID=UPI001915696D|nr:hypothetical protein [Kaistia sp. 32K]BCP56333.1 hypothetical protein K32_49500 [Kaistia sp. 32K]
MSELDRKEFRELEREVTVTSQNVVRMQEQISGLQRTVEAFVTKSEFAPVKLIVYGLAGGALTAVLSAVLNNVIAK